MRTKTTLAAAAILAAGLASSMAQNVYSLNVVGYVNKTYTGGTAYMVTGPFSNGANTLNDVIQGATDNSLVFRWDFPNQDISHTPDTYSAGLGTWVPNPTIAAGQGFLFVPADNITITYVGEVRQGASGTVQMLAGGANMTGSPVPIAGDANAIMVNFPAGDNDLIFNWETVNQDITHSPITYSAGLSSWLPSKQIGLAEGFLFVSASGGAVTWNRNFTVQ